MNRRSERGDWRFGPIAGLIIIVLAIIGLFAVCFDSDDDAEELDGHGRIALISHEYDGGDGGDERERCYSGYECRGGGSGNEGEYRDDNRRAGISPGPFDRSPVDFRDNRVTICFPFSRCDSAEDDEPQPGPLERS